MIRTIYSFDWFTIGILIIFMGLVFAKLINSTKFNLFTKLIFSEGYWINQAKERHPITAFEIILFFVANIILSLVVYLWIDYFEFSFFINTQPILQVGILYFMGCGFLLVKYYLEKFINLSTFNSPFFNYYLFYKQTSFVYSLFLSLPTIIIYVYLPIEKINFLQLNALLLSILYLGFMIAFVYKYKAELLSNWYYNILYLCALEIAPYYFLYKVLDNF